jgi:hypothetical protein
MAAAHTHSITINKWSQIKYKTGAQNMHCLLASFGSLTYYKYKRSKIWLQKFFISDIEWSLRYLHSAFKRLQHFSCLSIMQLTEFIRTIKTKYVTLQYKYQWKRKKFIIYTWSFHCLQNVMEITRISLKPSISQNN